MPSAPPPAPRKRRWLKRLLIWGFSLSLVLVILAAGAGVVGWFYITEDLPQVESIADYRPPSVTRVLAADGSLMVRYYHQRRFVVPLSEISPMAVKAFVAAEDGNFFHHQGIDLAGIARATIANIRAGRVVQGASTISQQVAQALLNTPARAWVPKIKEMIFAWRMEHELSKQDILYIYLNEIYLGHGTYGVEAAARTYFGKPAKDLNVAEAALIAGLIQAPSRYSPLRHPRRARARQVYVIERMQADGSISPEQAQAALTQPLDIKLHRPQTVAAPYYEETVRQWLEERYGKKMLYEQGLIVHTACDPGLTAAGRAAIKKGLAQLTRRQGYFGPVKRISGLELDKARSVPVGQGSLEPGAPAEAVVTALDPARQRAELRLGPARGYIALDQVRWAKPPRKKPDDYRPPLKKIGQVFKPGDVVRVMPMAYQAKARAWQLKLVQEPVAQAALLAMENGSGRVRVLIGGSDFFKSQFNRALQAHRQPGSAFKPFIYAAALDHPKRVYTSSTVVLDAPITYDDPTQPGEKWRPKNYSSRFYGSTTLRQALAHSRNVVTVKLLSDLGLGYVVEYARRLGITSELAPNLSLALGTSGLTLLELTRAYGVFADHGVLMEPVFVEKVLDRDGREIYKAEPKDRQVISPQTAYLTTHLLQGVIQEGTGRRMRALKRPLAGKTGTTNDLRDAWFVGFSPQLICGVWVGQDDNRPLGRKETGSRAAGPIWQQFMGQALKDQPASDFPVPEGVVFVRVDRLNGQPVPAGGKGGFFESFLEGRQPQPGQPTPGQTEGRPQDFLQSETFSSQGAPPADPPAPALAPAPDH
ncbi:MAG: PBP1A family penicillin-binding protein [Desulfarculaceae bacterium]|nr:PBP1A family penicillin-binding protein [Desulfarculaceae bacterium]MCF8073114.1 PBP1A family penicillin-binding protein [Desulfarculaceae bacterium]MCF8101801.1 PBP1A family penicillin-binding protein [Desulfarculaceae bacterium]MCF8117365.1 PBP1A family penicillin-binding protein [Desulfarculaceae bacterium]